MAQSPKIYGLIGYPVKHSLSSIMHNAAFKAAGINAEYKLFEVSPQDLKDFLINRTDVIGFNITIPHKIEAKRILDEEGIASTDSYAAMLGAINTVKRDIEETTYYNTDAPGFSRSLKEDLGFNPKGESALVLGCGGAGRAVVAGLMNQEMKNIYVYEQAKEAAEVARSQFSSAENVSFIGQEQLVSVVGSCQLLVNATPLGMHDDDSSAVDKNLLHKDLFVYDVVYNRNRDTQLIKDAKSLNLPYASGLGMLLYQGVLAWEIWTGQEAPVEVMQKALKEAVHN